MSTVPPLSLTPAAAEPKATTVAGPSTRFLTSTEVDAIWYGLRHLGEREFKVHDVPEGSLVHSWRTMYPNYFTTIRPDHVRMSSNEANTQEDKEKKDAAEEAKNRGEKQGEEKKKSDELDDLLEDVVESKETQLVSAGDTSHNNKSTAPGGGGNGSEYVDDDHLTTFPSVVTRNDKFYTSEHDNGPSLRIQVRKPSGIGYTKLENVMSPLMLIRNSLLEKGNIKGYWAAKGLPEKESKFPAKLEIDAKVELTANRDTDAYRQIQLFDHESGGPEYVRHNRQEAALLAAEFMLFLRWWDIVYETLMSQIVVMRSCKFITTIANDLIAERTKEFNIGITARINAIKSDEQAGRITKEAATAKREEIKKERKEWKHGVTRGQVKKVFFMKHARNGGNVTDGSKYCFLKAEHGIWTLLDHKQREAWGLPKGTDKLKANVTQLQYAASMHPVISQYSPADEIYKIFMATERVPDFPLYKELSHAHDETRRNEQYNWYDVQLKPGALAAIRFTPRIMMNYGKSTFRVWWDFNEIHYHSDQAVASHSERISSVPLIDIKKPIPGARPSGIRPVQSITMMPAPAALPQPPPSPSVAPQREVRVIEEIMYSNRPVHRPPTIDHDTSTIVHMTETEQKVPVIPPPAKAAGTKRTREQSTPPPPPQPKPVVVVAPSPPPPLAAAVSRSSSADGLSGDGMGDDDEFVSVPTLTQASPPSSIAAKEEATSGTGEEEDDIDEFGESSPSASKRARE